MVVQKSVNDCGVACLLYVLKYFGKNVTYKSVEEKIVKEKDGISAYEIIKVSKEFGISSCGYKNLKVNKNLTFPLIAHTINNNVQHFVVVLKVSNNNVYIMDPSYGFITKPKDEFNKSYTGKNTSRVYEYYAKWLAFIPNNMFQNMGKKRILPIWWSIWI